MNNPFNHSDWHPEISQMGFQSLIYDENGRLVASVEPSELGISPSHRQVCRLIAAAPKMYQMLIGLESSVPGEEIGALLSSITFGGFDIIPGRPL